MIAGIVAVPLVGGVNAIDAFPSPAVTTKFVGAPGANNVTVGGGVGGSDACAVVLTLIALDAVPIP